MPVVEVFKTLPGFRDYPDGTITLSGKDFREFDSYSTPNKVKRPKPLDISEFSLSNTPRVYYSGYQTRSSYGRKKYSGYVERTPVGYLGGVGFNGFTLSVPKGIQTRLALRIKNQKANLAITLAQYRQLTTLFSSFATSVLQLANNLQRVRSPMAWSKALSRGSTARQRARRFSPAVRPILQGASAVYLGYLFGLQQFASDFTATSEALRRRFEDPVYQQCDPLFFRELASYTRKGGSGTDNWNAEITDIITTRVKARWRVFPNEQVLAQMGMTNPLVALYDFIPFSFVLNWLIPVGQYLATLDALVGVSDLRWYYTTKSVQESHITYPGWGASATFNWEELVRTGVSTTLKPPLPTYEPSKHASNVLTAVALLSALSKRPATGNTILKAR